MASPPYDWPLIKEFINRTDELTRLATWWEGATREPISIIGRRRVGKSWLFRRFAHGKPAIVLVSEQLIPGVQLARFAEQLEPVLGVRPDIPDVQSLFRILFRLAREDKTLVVIDEFPWLLGSSSAESIRTLTSLQAVMEEERDSSKLKLVLCGSQVGLMESLFAERNPMHGRIERLEVRPLPFQSGAKFFTDDNPIERFERFAICGGMPMYLARLATATIRDAVCNSVLDRDAPLWNEGRTLIDQELREPRVYFALLERLATGAQELNEIAQPLRIETSTAARYLNTLAELRLVSKRMPFGALENSRSGRWQLDDPFLRFWFRFVFPYQSDLEAGLSTRALYDAEIAPVLAKHVSRVFENWCVDWLRANRADIATTFGTWWGNSANEFRKTKERSTEEIDAIGARRGVVTIAAEAKWTNKLLTPSIVDDLRTYKVPALRESGLRIAKDPRIVLFSRSGYSKSLQDLASEDPHIELIDIAAELHKSIALP